MNKIINWFLEPFKENFAFLFLLVLLFSTTGIYSLINNHLISYAIYIGFHAYITAYFLCLTGQIFPTKGHSIYKKTVLFVAIICFMIDLFCLIIYDTRFNYDFAIIIMQTNIPEIKEFIESYISMKHIYLTVIILLHLLAYITSLNDFL